jgi:hypothetical protein
MNAFGRKSLLLYIFLISLNSFLFGQFKSHIHVFINDVQYENGILTVKYHLENAKENDKIRVWIDLFDSKNDTIKAKSWEGDIRRSVSGKNEKVATWNLFKDEIDLVDSITLKISATVENRFYLDDPLILSTVYPGLGDYQIRAQKSYWIYGAVGYSLLGSSIGMYYNSRNNYNKYLNAKTIDDKNKYFQSSVLSKNLSIAFVSVAGFVWAMDYISILKRKKEIKQMWKKNLPESENPNIPSFKIVSSISNKVFINTRLTNLQLVKGSAKYIDLDQNTCLDAFEEGYIEFELYNRGPAKAVSFYARISTNDKNSKISYPDSLLIDPININQSKIVRFPIKANKGIGDGSLTFNVSVSALYNRPVEPFIIDISTCKFDYKTNVSEKDLVSDVDFNIPVLPPDNREKFALIIGNEGYANEYTGLSKNFNVPFARNDALAFKKYAIDVLGVREKNILFILDANKKEMSDNIMILTDRVKQLKNQAELIFYFAGQGLADTNTTAPFIMPVDIPPSKINSAISLDSLYRKISDSKSFRSIVILDASFNNGGRNMGLRGPSAKKIQFRPEVIPSNTVVFSAVWKNYDIYSDKGKSHGLFTYAILKTLKNTQGKLSFLQLDNLINNEILSYSKVPNENRASSTFFSKDISDIWPNWMVR